MVRVHVVEHFFCSTIKFSESVESKRVFRMTFDIFFCEEEPSSMTPPCSSASHKIPRQYIEDYFSTTYLSHHSSIPSLTSLK